MNIDLEKLFTNTINQDLVDFFLTLEGNFIYDCADTFDIKKEFTHEFLLNNNQIDDAIKKYYEIPIYTIREQYKTLDYSWSPLLPYSFIFNGIRINVSDLILFLQSIVIKINRGTQEFKCNDRIINCFEDLVPYFIDYGEGFKQGYNTFETEISSMLIPNFSDKNDFINKVFEFLINNKHSNRRIWKSIQGYQFDFLNSSIIGGYNNGLIEGYFYKAWSIVFSNNHLFTDLFKSLSIENDNTITRPPNSSNELHVNIFCENGFKVWEFLFENFNIKESSRSDVKFIYEEMKKDKLIFNTVSQVHFLDWIYTTYGLVIGKTSNHSKTQKRISIYSNAKLLYKT